MRSRAIAAAFVLLTGLTALPQAAPNLVEASFQAFDAAGTPAPDLQATDIALREDGHPQEITRLIRIDADARNDPFPDAGGEPRFDGGHFDGHRLVVLYFDLTSLSARDLVAAQFSAAGYVQHGMRPNDLVCVAAVQNALQMLQDFTSDKSALLAAIGSFQPEVGDSGAANGGEMTAAERSFVALEALHQGLADLQPRKLEVYYSGGVVQTGTGDAIPLRSAVNAAVKGNIAVYAVDARLLPARAGGGAAPAASNSANTPTTQLTHGLDGQEALHALGFDSGGDALLDSADDTAFFKRMEDNSRFYYLASYSPTNPKRDGKYRKVEISTTRPGVKIVAMPGYTAPKK